MEDEWFRPMPEENMMTTFGFRGGNNPYITDIQENIIRLVDGRTFTRDEIENDTSSVLISRELAGLNGLSVGSTIAFEMRVFENTEMMPLGGMYTTEVAVSRMWVEPSEPAEILNFEFDVIGIFEPTRGSTGPMDWEYSERQNRLYTTNVAISYILDSRKEVEMRINPNTSEEQHFIQELTTLFVLDDPLDLENFREAANNIIPSHYILRDTGEAFDAVAAPMRNMEFIASIILYVAIGATLIILSLLVTLFLRDRKHEIGIYISLGEKRKKVVGQILLEVMLVSFVAITLSLFSGNLIANEMSHTMLANQIRMEEENRSNDDWGRPMSRWNMPGNVHGHGEEISMDDIRDAYEVTLDLGTILIFYGIGLGTIILSSVIPIVYIMRLNPKKILM
ncbi:MAG: ABC transporter permease [Oscillospiraceae bacterium]|nr:ABC transporter permease [Oscillospiraceae bacterium]